MRLLPRVERDKDKEERLESTGRQFKEQSWRGGGGERRRRSLLDD